MSPTALQRLRRKLMRKMSMKIEWMQHGGHKQRDGKLIMPKWWEDMFDTQKKIEEFEKRSDLKELTARALRETLELSGISRSEWDEIMDIDPKDLLWSWKYSAAGKKRKIPDDMREFGEKFEKDVEIIEKPYLARIHVLTMSGMRNKMTPLQRHIAVTEVQEEMMADIQALALRYAAVAKKRWPQSYETWVRNQERFKELVPEWRMEVGSKSRWRFSLTMLSKMLLDTPLNKLAEVGNEILKQEPPSPEETDKLIKRIEEETGEKIDRQFHDRMMRPIDMNDESTFKEDDLQWYMGAPDEAIEVYEKRTGLKVSPEERKNLKSAIPSNLGQMLKGEDLITGDPDKATVRDYLMGTALQWEDDGPVKNGFKVEVDLLKKLGLEVDPSRPLETDHAGRKFAYITQTPEEQGPCTHDEMVRKMGSHVKKKQRVGRGAGSKRGKNSCRGQGGQNKRTSGGTRPWFDGGATPLYRRLPKFVRKPLGPGWHWQRKDSEPTLLTLKMIEHAPEGSTVDWLTLRDVYRAPLQWRKRMIRPIKVVSLNKWEDKNFKLTKKNLTVKAHAFTKPAARQIIALGGKCLVLQKKTHDKVVMEYDPDREGHDKIPKRFVWHGPLPKAIRKKIGLERYLAKKKEMEEAGIAQGAAPASS